MAYTNAVQHTSEHVADARPAHTHAGLSTVEIQLEHTTNQHPATNLAEFQHEATQPTILTSAHLIASS
jgi:hypothetical protein